MRITDDHRGSGGLDKVSEMRVREFLAKGVNGRRREDDVANLPEPHEKDAHRPDDQFVQ